MRDHVKFICWMILAAFVIGMTAGICSVGKCDEPSVESAKARLKQIEQQKQQEKDLAEAKAAEELERQKALIEPVPVPQEFTKPEPSIRFEAPVKSADAERLPRAVLVVAQFCSPCQRMESELCDLIGGPEAPIQMVKNWLANDLDDWGIPPGMQIGNPWLFILDKDGKVHGLNASGASCLLRGYHSREQVLAYLKQAEHGVDINPVQQAPVVAELENAEATPDSIAAVLAAHLIESSQEEPDEPVLYGSLFSFDVDVPKSWKSIGQKILKAQTIDFPAAGLKLDWTGEKRTVSISSTEIGISPSIKATVKKWGISYGCGLDGFKFEPDLSSVTVLLTGAPDLTVRLK